MRDQLLPASILEHALWPQIRKYFRAQLIPGRRRTSYRIEVDDIFYELRRTALSIQVQCAACKQPIHPIRERHGQVRRPRAQVARMYCSVTCPNEESPGCHRGTAASSALLAIAADLLGALPSDQQASL